MNSIFSALEAEVKSLLESASGCHDFDHTMRVLANARRLAALESGADLAVVETAALLHDIGRPEEIRSKGRHCHARYGAELAAVMMEKLDCSPDFIARVAACIRTHRFRGRQTPPQTLEEKIVYDADKLDSIGAVGIGRAFYFAGREGARLHNTAEEAVNSAEYSREDSAYREYLVKLRHVEERMLTASGRELARERAAFMHEFFDRLNAETGQ
jgi:uncharacterized protein